MRLFLLGSGEERFVRWARDLAATNPDRLHSVDEYNLALAHQIFAGADLLAMPSRFEPCGLAQMQAMRYGTIPVVTPVGGLRDTVLDANTNETYGNGFVAKTIDVAGMVDAIHRAAALFKYKTRRLALQRLGMAQDWSWEASMKRHLELYEAVASRQTKSEESTASAHVATGKHHRARPNPKWVQPRARRTHPLRFVRALHRVA